MDCIKLNHLFMLLHSLVFMLTQTVSANRDRVLQFNQIQNGVKITRDHFDEQPDDRLQYNPDREFTNPFYLTVQGNTWIQCLPPAIHVNKKWYKASDGSLKWLEYKTMTGSDKHGDWLKELNYYSAGDVNFITTITHYYDQPIILYGQEFPDGAEMTFTGDPMSSTMSAWPVFVRKKFEVDLGYLAYGGIMAGDTDKHIGRWSDTGAHITSGIYSGPIVLFDQELDNVLLVSPFDQFLATSTMSNSTESSISYGVMGNASHIPPGFKMETILFFGTEGINKVFQDWGKLMQYEYARTGKYVLSDFTNNYLGYWMDGGGYYSYRSEPNKTMEQTVLDMKAQSQKQKVPYRYVEFDEWFYCQCKGEPTFPCCDSVGTEIWEAAPGVFPGGFTHLSHVTKWPVHGSNKWWSSTTPYAKQNGGNFTFVIDTDRKGSLPVDQRFWDYLMNMAVQRGQIVYEQDFQSTQFQHLWHLTSNVTLGRTWYTQMGKGAELHGIVIQYCMAPSRAILQALEIPTVTQARASGDYRPGGTNWKIGISSMFLNAMGIRPFKDNFWTTAYQSGYNFGNFNETQLDVVNLVAVMSMGPVGPSDKINHTDPVRLMRCCNEDGLILQPSFPPTAIDSEIRNIAFSSDLPKENQIWSTSSIVSGLFFGIIMALEVNSDTVLYPKDVFSHLTHLSEFTNMAVYSNFIPHEGTVKTTSFDQFTPLMIGPDCQPKSPCVFYTTPKFQVGEKEVYIVGELSKWVPVSPKRIQSIVVSDDLMITITGMSTETVELFIVVDSFIVSQKCTIPQWGQITLHVLAGKCV